MKIYLVGGAVRDRLLGYPVKERDWVVVGGSPQALLNQGYQQVGRDFPVFLHPKTKEEYALARTERKTAPGYYGFICDFNPEVTLEEDLARRDLTINAMAEDEKGRLIDPYHGQDDLKAKLLRHVSPAFVEDPLRVLRVARFAARYHHLGFKLADETRLLMYRMVKRKELGSLMKERIWQEWQQSLEEKNPEVFIEVLRACGALEIILPELHALFGIPNPLPFHLEIDTGVHTLMVLQAATVLTDDPRIRFAVLMHDVGKAKTPMADWPEHKGHEEHGNALIRAISARLAVPNDYRDLALLVAQYHGVIHKSKRLKPEVIVTILEEIDAFRREERFEQLLLACEADAQGMGRNIKYDQTAHWRHFLKECVTIDAKPFIEQGLIGREIKAALHQQRVERIKKFLEIV
jgi:tRNA nucleotidyltransferase (CCA-adding enzyme)